MSDTDMTLSDAPASRTAVPDGFVHDGEHPQIPVPFTAVIGHTKHSLWQRCMQAAFLFGFLHFQRHMFSLRPTHLFRHFWLEILTLPSIESSLAGPEAPPFVATVLLSLSLFPSGAITP